MHVHPSADSRRCIVPGFLNLCLVEIVLSADPAYVQSLMHGVHTWPKVLVWTPETLRASQSEKDTSVPCCLYLSQHSSPSLHLTVGAVGAVGAVRAVRAVGAGGAGGRAGAARHVGFVGSVAGGGEGAVRPCLLGGVGV